jgi:hypothetical protein
MKRFMQFLLTKGRFLESKATQLLSAITTASLCAAFCRVLKSQGNKLFARPRNETRNYRLEITDNLITKELHVEGKSFSLNLFSLSSS